MPYATIPHGLLWGESEMPFESILIADAINIPTFHLRKMTINQHPYLTFES